MQHYYTKITNWIKRKASAEDDLFEGDGLAGRAKTPGPKRKQPPGKARAKPR